ncbi:Uncharacterised protein [Vibrio cholerae]|nr:Uncharacterised protein [Vibrio cholerae]
MVRVSDHLRFTDAFIDYRGRCLANQASNRNHHASLLPCFTLSRHLGCFTRFNRTAGQGEFSGEHFLGHH